MIEDQADDPTRDAARQIADAARLVAVGLAAVAARNANQRADNDRETAGRLRTQTDLARAARAVAATRTAKQQAAHTAQHARAGVRVTALDRGNVGTVVDVDDQAGTVSVHFRSPEGREATRDLPWDKVQVLDPPDARTPPVAGTHRHTEQAPSLPPRAGLPRARDVER